jgi:hypothetical protein
MPVNRQHSLDLSLCDRYRNRQYFELSDRNYQPFGNALQIPNAAQLSTLQKSMPSRNNAKLAALLEKYRHGVCAPMELKT